MKILISDTSGSHASSIESLILSECPLAETVIRLEDFNASVLWSISNSVNIICRAVSDFSADSKADSDLAWSNNIGVVYSHGSDSHIEIDRGGIGSACLVGYGNSTENLGSYGSDIDFYANTSSQSNATAIVAGLIGQILTNNPSWNFLDARHVVRQTSSGYSTTGWSIDGGFGLIDKTSALAVSSNKTISPPYDVEYILTSHQIEFSFFNYEQSNFVDTIISIFTTKPDFNSLPTDGTIIYTGSTGSFKYTSDESKIFWAGFYSVNSDGDYSQTIISTSFKFGGSIDRMGISRNAILSIKDYLEEIIDSYGYDFTFVSSWGEDKSIVTPEFYNTTLNQDGLIKIPAGSINVGTRSTGRGVEIGSASTRQPILGSLFIYAENEPQLYDLLDVLLQSFENGRGLYIKDFSYTGYPNDDAPIWFYVEFVNAEHRPFIDLSQPNIAMKYAGIINFTCEFIREL